jgi:uncharacterized membrane protein YdjX (TVP38/TMEM64 family)
LIVPIAWIALILAIPIVPFVAFGEPMEARIEGYFDATFSPVTLAGLGIGLFVADIFLPVPSSAINTILGNRLGFLLGTATAWTGMTLAASLAFGLARWLGRPLATRLAGEEELEKTDMLSRRLGPAILVLARPVPVLAEASVLFFGTTRLSWWRFLVPVGLSNLGIAAVYAALGRVVELRTALIASIALPLLAATIAHFCWPRKDSPRDAR